MKLLVIGCGQCGGRIADEFAHLNVRAHRHRGLNVITNAIAISTDIADLSGLSFIKPDFQHRMLLGGRKTSGRGVGKINELAADIVREEADRILEGIRATKNFYETDAFLLIASAAGGTGSGAIPVLSQYLKEHYPEKPLYNLIVLPFKYEEKVEERIIYNTATCLKSTYLVADAIFLVDHKRYTAKTASSRNNLARINAEVVAPFYNLLCAGEEKKTRYIGAKILDAGDIIQTLSGWTVIGHARSKMPLLKLPSGVTNFRDKVSETQKWSYAMNDAINELSLKCNPADAKRALYLLSAPPEEMNMNLIYDISSALKNIATEAVIRSGDYPRERHSVSVTLILSELLNVEKVMDYFTKAIRYISAYKKRREGIEYKPRGMVEAFKDIPSLI